MTQSQLMKKIKKDVYGTGPLKVEEDLLIELYILTILSGHFPWWPFSLCSKTEWEWFGHKVILGNYQVFGLFFVVVGKVCVCAHCSHFLLIIPFKTFFGNLSA